MTTSAPVLPRQAQEWQLRRELAAVYRLVAQYGMSDLIFTHISVRLPGPEHHFLINPNGLFFEEITASSLVKIDLDGRIVEPSVHHDDLGDHPVMILRNHGLLTVRRSPAEAFLRMFYLQRACEIQLDAQSGGAELALPSPQVCSRTAAQFAGTADDDLPGDPQIELDLVWSAFIRLLGRVAPDYAD